MAEATSVGSIYLDLVVRDTVEKQLQAISTKAQAQAQQAFSGVEKIISGAAEKAVSQASKSTQEATGNVSKAVHKIVDSAATVGKQVSASFDGAFDKSVAMAQSRVNELTAALERVTAKRKEAAANNDDATTERLLDRQAVLYDKLAAARERLSIQEQAAAQKASIAAERAAQKQQAAIQRQKAAEEAALQRAAVAAERASAKREAAEQKAAMAAERAAQKAAAAEERAANRKKAIQASMWKNMLAKAGSMTKAITGKLSGMGKGFSSVGKTASRFGSRLREIASGALIFNGISAALRSVTAYFGDAVSSSGEMKTALANLRGAAATAAAPIVESLTPALVSLTNAAATALSYLSRLISYFTGKSLSSMANAAKKVQTSANAAKKAMASLAGFDEIQRMGGDSGGSGGEGAVEQNYEFQGQSSFLDSIMESVKAGQWEQVGSLVAQKLNDSLAAIQWPDVCGKAKEWTQNIVDVLNSSVSELNWDLLGNTIGNGLNTILLVIDTFFQEVDWGTLGSNLGAGLGGLFETLDWETLGRILTDKFKSVMELLGGFVREFDFAALGSNLSAMLMAFAGNVDWGRIGQTLSTGAIGLLTSIATFLEGLNWQEIGDNIEEFLSNVDWSGIATSLFEGIGAALGGIGALIWGIIEDEWDSFMDDWVKYTELCGGDAIAGLLTGILLGLANIGTWIWDNVFVPIWDGICSAFDIHSPSKKMEGIGENIIAGMLNGLIYAWTIITDFFANSFDKLKATITTIWEDGILPAIKGPVNSIISCINGMISGIVSGMNTVIRALNKLKFTIPDWVPAFGGKSFGFNIGYLSAPKIPMLADGGVIEQPTLAMMGEYAGAKNNPEIVTPQSVMAETVATVMEDVIASNVAGFEAVVAVLREILEAILGIEIDGEIISKAVERYNRKMAVVRGG